MASASAQSTKGMDLKGYKFGSEVGREWRRAGATKGGRGGQLGARRGRGRASRMHASNPPNARTPFPNPEWLNVSKDVQAIKDALNQPESNFKLAQVIGAAGPHRGSP